MATTASSLRESAWITTEPQVLDCRSWQQLVRNEIPLVLIPNFATADECASVAGNATRIGFEPYENVDPPIDRIGITVFEYDRSVAARYFDDAYEARAIQNAIFGRSFDPVERLMQRLSEVADAPVTVAVDPVLGRYHAGLVRKIERGTLLHIDYAPAEQPGWHVGKVEAQFGWNVYVKLTPAYPGVTHVYNRRWSLPDGRFKEPHSYGFRREVVAGAQRVTFEPTLGNVYMFNTRNFHEVEPSGGCRMACGSAIGILPDGQIVLWS